MMDIDLWESTSTDKVADSPENLFEAPYDRARRRIRAILSAGHPTLCAYSSGKDSSTLVGITLSVAKEMIAESEICPPIIVLHSNTGVEHPVIAKLAQTEMQRMMQYAREHDIPFSSHTSHPELYDTFGARVIGGRALPAFPDSRADCSTSWKILPNQRTMRRVLDELGQIRVWAEPVVMTGVRLDESNARDQRIATRGETAEGLWRNDNGNLRLSPLLDWSSDDVWEHIGLCNAGERESFSDFAQVMHVYSASGGDSCVIVADMKSAGNRKPCGTRTGCFLCTRVGEDRSFRNMIASDWPRYGHLEPLAALRDFVSRTQYDWSRRQFVGRTIDAEGFITIQADTYAPSMLKELLRYTLSAQVLSGVEIIPIEQLIAIDARWSQYSLCPPFTALKIYFEVMDGDVHSAPEVPRFPKTDVPRIGKIFVGRSYADGLRGEVAGLRDVSMEMHHENCGFELKTLNDGSIVIDVESQEDYNVDLEGAADFLSFIAEDKIRAYCHQDCSDWTFGFKTYLQYGTLAIRKGRSTQCHEILQRSQWRQKHQLHGQQSVEELEERCDVLFSRQLALI